MAASRPSRTTWAGGLYKRLLARGFDPYSAKMVSRHIRADLRPFLELLVRELAAEFGWPADLVELVVERELGIRA